MVGGAMILLGAELGRQASQTQFSTSYLWAKHRLGSLADYRMSA